VSGYSIIDSDDDPEPQAVLPDIFPVMGFQYRGKVAALRDGMDVSLETCGITGLQMTARQYRYLPRSGTVLVRFQPWGAAAFLPAPMHEIAGKNLGLADLLAPGRIRETEDRLMVATDDPGRIVVIETFLLRLLRGSPPDPTIRRAVALLSHGGTEVSLARLSRGLNLSERQLERKFKSEVGLGPWRFARLARFRKSLANLAGGHFLGATAMDAGFYDQAHFSKEFSAFAGENPSAYLRRIHGSGDVGFLQG